MVLGGHRPDADVVRVPCSRFDWTGAKHWFNHLQVTLDGSRFIFLHRWTGGGAGTRRITGMFTADPAGKDLHIIDDYGGLSHFIWCDPRHILGWAQRPPRGGRFNLYEDGGEKVEVVGDGVEPDAPTWGCRRPSTCATVRPSAARSAIFGGGTIGMDLLTEELRRRLPPISQLHTMDAQSMIFAKFLAPHSRVTFYVAEGEQRQEDYVLWGLLVTPWFKFPSRFEITLKRLQSSNWIGGEPCERDDTFQPDLWESIERTVPNFHRPLAPAGRKG